MTSFVDGMTNSLLSSIGRGGVWISCWFWLGTEERRSCTIYVSNEHGSELRGLLTSPVLCPLIEETFSEKAILNSLVSSNSPESIFVIPPSWVEYLFFPWNSNRWSFVRYFNYLDLGWNSGAAIFHHPSIFTVLSLMHSWHMHSTMLPI